MIKKNKDAGGCITKKKTKNEQIFDGIKINNKKKPSAYINIHCNKSTNNNCLFACLNEFYDKKGNECKADTIRRSLNITLNTPIN
jgi:hypothetical protein